MKPLDRFFIEIYNNYYVIKNPIVKLLFFIIVLSFLILNIILSIFSFEILCGKKSISHGVGLIFGIEMFSFDHTVKYSLDNPSGYDKIK